MKVDGLIGGGSAEAGLSAVVAAGPYCIADDLAYDPLHEMLTELKASPPQMLVRSSVQRLLPETMHVETAHTHVVQHNAIQLLLVAGVWTA